ncbi:MAG: type II secretion system protein [Patescibacteria group bacterium]|jgi:prepilin-type N-terminal cleavage/methylation domain-containing protein
MKTKKGFTLIELLVVVAIIGLLATLGVIAFRNAQQKARDTKRLGDMRSVTQAINQANNEGGFVLCNYTAATKKCAAGAIAAGAKVNAIAICPGAACAVVDPDLTLANLSNLKDPQTAAATASCAAGTVTLCEYAFEAGAKIDDFKINFYTEQIDLSGVAASHAHSANINGILN